VQTADQAKQDFFRLMNTNQMVNSLFTNAISYESFMNGYHIIAYDLTTAQDGGSEAFANPSVRVGKTYFAMHKILRYSGKSPTYAHFFRLEEVLNKYSMHVISGNLRVRLNFSEPTKVDLTLLAIAEFNSVIELNSKGLVMTSYTSK
jgi:hypothetical protein